MPDDEVIPGTETEEEIKTGTEDTEETEEETQDTEDLDESALKEAKSLYKLLKDPSTAEQVIRILAIKAKVITEDGKPPTTAAEIKEAKKDIKAIIEEGLGEEFKFFGPKLTKIMEDVLAEERKNYAQETGELKLAQVQQQVETVETRLNKETGGDYKKLQARVAQLVDRYPQPSGTSVYDYLKEMYQLAGGKTKSNSTQRIADKIQQNSKDATTRLRTSRGGSTTTTQTAVVPVKRGLRAAVEAAVKELEK